MKYTEIAAFGGLALGMINLLIVLYKDFWRKGKPVIELLDINIKFLTAGIYYYQINMIITAKASDIQIKKIEIGNNNAELAGKTIYDVVKAETLKYACPLTDENLLSIENKEQMSEEINDFLKEKIKIQDYSIAKDRHASLTFIGRLFTTRFSDGHIEIPINNWYLKVFYNDRQVKIPFNFRSVDKDARGHFLN